MRTALCLLVVFGVACSGKNGLDGVGGTDGTKGSNGQNGQNGTNELVNVVTEPPGANCQYGGEAIETGLDLDGNGKLNSNEVTSTTYVCNTTPAPASTIYGDVMVSNSAELAQLAGITKITGALAITVPVGLTTITVPDLVEVGSFVLINQQAATTVALPALTKTDAMFALDDEAKTITSLSVPKLTSVGTIALTSGAFIDLSAFATVAGTTGIQLSGTQVTNLSLPAVTSLSSLSLNADVQLASLATLPVVLTTIDSITINEAFTDVSQLASLTSVTHDLSLTLPKVADLSTPLANVTSIGGAFSVSFGGTSLALAKLTLLGSLGYSSLTTLSLPVMTTIASAFDSGKLGGLIELDVPALTTAHGDLTFYYVTTLNLGPLATVGGTLSYNTTSSTASFPSLTTVGGGIFVSNINQSIGVSLPVLISVTSALSINGATTLSTPVLATAGGLSLSNGTMTELDFPELVAGGAIQIYGNYSLTTLTMPNLTSASSFEVQYNYDLPNCVAVNIAAQLPNSAIVTVNTNGGGSC